MTYDVRARKLHTGDWHAEARSPEGVMWRHKKPFDDGFDAWVYVWKIRAHVRQNEAWAPNEAHWTKVIDPSEVSSMPGFD